MNYAHIFVTTTATTTKAREEAEAAKAGVSLAGGRMTQAGSQVNSGHTKTRMWID